MAYTPAQLAALQQALATGEQRVTFADKTVEYRSVDELKTAIREVQNGLLAQAASTDVAAPRKSRQVRVITNKGC
jgi:hypothetical protein